MISASTALPLHNSPLMTQPDIMRNSFRVELKTELPYWFVILPIIFLIGVITRSGFISSWPLMMLFLFVLVAFSVLTYRLNLIEIDAKNGEAVLTETNLVMQKKVRRFPLGELQFTCKKGKFSAYSRVVKICRLYLNDKELAVISPDRDGWTDETVNELVKGLVNFNVSKKFIGFSYKDAEIDNL